MLKALAFSMAAASLMVATQAVAKDQIFKHFYSSDPVIKQHVAYLYHPQMIDSRTGMHYDISARSNLNGTCYAFDFDHGSVGADFFMDRAFQAVFINARGEVTGIDHDVMTIQMLKCSAY